MNANGCLVSLAILLEKDFKSHEINKSFSLIGTKVVFDLIHRSLTGNRILAHNESVTENVFLVLSV